MELYKKHRPRRLSSVVGNGTTVAALGNMLKRKTLPHTILFHGPSGCGKTTLARIIVRELDCHQMDFQEVNASSFRGIDSIRDVARIMNLAPVGTCRIWLFDETHKWTNDAQNAALKMLEDTPEHVYFFLCTTDPQKLIKPIRTRCCEMPVRSLSYSELETLAKRVAKKEELALSDDCMGDLIESAQGSARSLLVMMDKLVNIDEEDRAGAIAASASEQSEGVDLCKALIARRPWPAVAKILQDLTADPETVRYSVLGWSRAVLINGGQKGKKGNADHQAYLVIRCFESPFYDSKAAGLAAACYEAIHGE